MKSYSLIAVGIGLLGFICTSCNQSSNTKEKHTNNAKVTSVEPVKKISVNEADNVYIKGTSDTPERLTYFNFLNYSYFFGSNEIPELSTIQNDSLILKYNQPSGPQFKEVMYFGKDGNFINTKPFVTPGDSIYFTITNEKIVFTGTHANEYNYYGLLKNNGYDYSHVNFKGNTALYKKEIKAVYKKAKAFLETYCKTHKDLSDSFKKFAEDELFFEYYYNLMAPRSVQAICIDTTYDTYGNTMKGVFSVVANSQNENQLFDSKEYFDDIPLSTFIREDLLSNDYYKRSLVDFVRYYYVKQEYFEYSHDNFKNEREFIESKFSGKLQNYLLGRLIHDYYKNGLGRSEASIALLQETIVKFKKQTIDSTYLDYINKVEEKLAYFELKLPKPVLEDKVLSVTGDTLTLREVLAKQGKRKKVIDVWASWCAPCIMELKNGAKTSKELADKHNISFIYLSGDISKEQWLKSVAKYKSQFASDDNYLFLDGPESKYSSYLKIEYIPRTTILDEKGRIIYGDSPRPSDSLKFKQILTR